MSTIARILVFGSVSGLLWSVAPGAFVVAFSSGAAVPSMIMAGIISGIVTSVILAFLLIRFGPGMTVALGFLSLPLGAFLFGFNAALIDRFFPVFTGGIWKLVEPWTVGFSLALLSLSNISAVVLLPLAIGTTLLLRSFIIRGRRTKMA